MAGTVFAAGEARAQGNAPVAGAPDASTPTGADPWSLLRRTFGLDIDGDEGGGDDSADGGDLFGDEDETADGGAPGRLRGTRADAPGPRDLTAPEMTGETDVLGATGDFQGDDPVATQRDYRASGFDSGLETVRNRQRPELDALGFRAGTFTAFPELVAETVHTDNLFQTANNQEADTRLSLRPSLLVRSDWSRHSLSLQAEGEWGAYQRFSSEDILRGSVAAEGRADVTPFFSAGLRLAMAAEQEGRGSSNAVAGATGPVRLRTSTAEVTLARRFNRLVATLRGGYAHTDYDDIGLLTGGIDNNDDRDVDSSEIGLRLAYEVSPAIEVYADVVADRRDYRQAIDDAGFRRPSTGWRGALGAALEATRIARLDLRAGYVARDYEDPALRSVGDYTVDGQLTWAMTPLTTIRARAGTEIGETTTAGASARLVRRASIGVDHELLRHFIISGDLGIETESLTGTREQTDRVTAALQGEYFLSREAAIVARASHDVERPNAAAGGGDVIENVVSVGVRLRR